MNTNIKYALAAIAGLSCLSTALAQEAAPSGVVRDAMEGSVVAPADKPTAAPKSSDLDRLFGEVPSPDNPAGKKGAAKQDSGGRAESIGSPLDDSLSLDDGDLISVDYPNEEIRTVLRNVADLYMLNLVIPDTLQGTASLKLRDVTWRQIYSVVLDPVGFTFVDDGSIIKIVSKEALNFEPPTTEIFILNYADAGTIAATVKSLIDETKGGRVQVDKRTNGLIVSERASKMDSLRSVIERLDKPTEQVFIETRFIEVSNTDVKNIGINWASLRGYGVGVGPFTHEVNRGFDRERIADNGAEVINESNLGSSSAITGNSLGTTNGRVVNNLTGQAVVDTSTFGQTSLLTSAINNLSGLIDTSTSGRTTNAMFTADQFRFVISALKEQGNSRLISNPTVVTLNNQEAYISVGEQYPLPQYKFNEETGSLAVNGFDYKDIGIILRVKPSVNHKGLISLTVKPEVSSRGEGVPFGETIVPIINTRVSETQIALKDGYTMGIGGLMQSRGSSGTSHVPLLGKIPGLGKLFKHENREETQLNLLIFITARILPSEVADFEDVFSEDAMNRAGVDPSTLKNR